jgi:hypothetical protein
MCSNCEKAAYELKLQTGTLKFDIPKVLNILTTDNSKETSHA